MTTIRLPHFTLSQTAAAAVLALSFTSTDCAAEETISLIGVARDFVDSHPDFGHLSGDHGGLITGIIAPELPDNATPQLTTNGRKVIHESTDAEGREIAPHIASAARGDALADMGSENRGGIDSESSFAGWFTDQVGTNLSTQVELVFQPIGNGVYVFDTEEDPTYVERDGFFPIDNMLYGNESTGGGRHNYNFSFELHAEFTYLADADQFVEVDGNSEIWIFIDGALVIDIGGVRPSDRRTQYFDLNRLGLEDGSAHSISIFIANRHRGTPNFRLETNVLFQTSKGTSVTPLFD